MSVPIVASFASQDVPGTLSATVTFPTGTTTATVTATGNTVAVNTGTTIVNEPSYNVSYTGTWTPPDESPGVGFTVTITDAGAVPKTTSVVGTTPVRNAALPAALTPATVNVTKGTAFSGAVATFADPNTLATTADFTGTIDWGDGTGLSNATFTGTPASFTVNGATPTLDPQAGPIRVVVNDKGGQVSSTSFALTSFTDPALDFDAGRLGDRGRQCPTDERPGRHVQRPQLARGCQRSSHDDQLGRRLGGHARHDRIARRWRRRVLRCTGQPYRTLRRRQERSR